MSRLTRMALFIATSILVASACGSDDKSSDSAGSTTATTTAATTEATQAAETSVAPSASTTSTTTATDLGTSEGGAAGVFSVEAANGTVTLAAAPVRIVSLSPTHTEMLFAIGAGDQVIAVDDQSNYPPEAEAVRTELSGFTPNVEAIAGYEPDLVVIADDFNGLGDQLAALEIPVWSGPTALSLDDTYSQLEQLGVLTGNIADAAAVVVGMQTDIESVLADVPETETPMSYYHELAPTYFSVTSNTFIGQLYSLVGLRNISDMAEVDSDYPQLSSELIVSADPELIFLADTKCCGESPETVAARDGWAGIAAVVNGNVIAMDDDLASRWGPRVVDYLRAVVDAVTAASLVTG